MINIYIIMEELKELMNNYYKWKLMKLLINVIYNVIEINYQKTYLEEQKEN